MNGNGTISASGSASEWTGGQINFGTGSLANSGTLTIATTTNPNNGFSLAGTVTNTGTIVVTGTNTIYANASGTTINNQTGATLDFQGAAGLNSNGQASTAFNNAGTLERSTGSGTATITFPVNDSGTIQGNSGVLLLTGGGSGAPGIVNAGTGGTVILGGTFSGKLTGSGAGSIVLSGFTGSSATLNFTGNVLEWANIQNGNALGGTITNQGTLTIATTTTPNNSLNLTGTLTNTGSIVVTGTNTIYANADGTTIDNQAGGSFDFQGAAYLNSNNETSTAFNNAGTLERTAGTGTATISFPVSNTGTIQGNAGTLLLTGGGSGGTSGNPGLVNAGTSGTVILGGSYSGTFAGSGTGSVVLSDFTGAGATLDFTGSVLEWANIQNGPNLAGTITNKGTLAIATTTTPNNGLELTGTLTNTGAIVVTGTNTIFANATGTTINNQAGGSFDFQGAAYLYSNSETSTAFNNAGTLERTTGTGTATISFPVNDTGTIQGNAGTLLLTGGGSGGPGVVNAGTGGTVILGGTYSGSLTGSGTGAVILSDFTGSNAALDFSGSVLQWTATQNGRNLAGTVTNSGALAIVTTTIPNNGVNLYGTLTNSGSITVTGTNRVWAEAVGAAIDNQAGGTFDFQSSAFLSNDAATGTFNNAGTLEVSANATGATIAFPVNDTGTIEGSLGVLYLTGGGSGGSGESPGFVNAALGATIVLSGTYSGSFAGSGTGAVDLSNFTGTNATLDFSGSVLQWTSTQDGYQLGGTITNLGALVIATTLIPNNGVTLYGTLTNAGTGSITVTGTEGIFAETNSAAIDNQAGGTFQFQSANALNNAGGTGTFNNAGILEMSAAGATATINFVVNDTGLIEGEAGTLDLTGGSGSGGASIYAAAGAAVVLSGSYTGTFAGSGSGSVQLAWGFVGGGTGVTLDFTGTVLQWIQGGSYVGGTINNTGTLTLDLSSYTYFSGTLNNTGTIDDTTSGRSTPTRAAPRSTMRLGPPSYSRPTAP